MDQVPPEALFSCRAVFQIQQNTEETLVSGRHPRCLAGAEVLFPSTFLIFKVLILTNQVQADLHTVGTSVSIYAAGGCLSSFYNTPSF